MKMLRHDQPRAIDTTQPPAMPGQRSAHTIDCQLVGMIADERICAITPNVEASILMTRWSVRVYDPQLLTRPPLPPVLYSLHCI